MCHFTCYFIHYSHFVSLNGASFSCFSFFNFLILTVSLSFFVFFFFFFQAEDGIRDDLVTGVQTCALPIWHISAMRLNFYPDQTAAPLRDQLRAGAHTDYGLLTILNGENVPGGLQVQIQIGRASCRERV